MSPSVDERITSVVRALTGVVLPALPPEASLAQEQVMLCIGHLQILGGQLDAAAAYEAEELRDAAALATALSRAAGGPKTQAAAAALRDALARSEQAADAAGIREARIELNAAVAGMISAASADGEASVRAWLPTTVIGFERQRVAKDRAWFAPFGFDSPPAAA
jgi:hypothetical protein